MVATAEGAITDGQNLGLVGAPSRALPRASYAVDPQRTAIVIEFRGIPGPEVREALKEAGFRYTFDFKLGEEPFEGSRARTHRYWWAPYCEDAIQVARIFAREARGRFLDPCLAAACAEVCPWQPPDEAEFMRLREEHAAQLRAYGFDPERIGQPTTARRVQLLRDLAAMDCYGVPADVLALAETGCMTAAEVAYAINAAYATYQGIGQEPAPYCMQNPANKLQTRREVCAGELVAAGFYASVPARFYLDDIVKMRDAKLIAFMASKEGSGVTRACADLALKGVLTRSEARCIINSARFRYQQARQAAEAE